MKKCENPACENIVTEYTKRNPTRLKQCCSRACQSKVTYATSEEKRKRTTLERHGVEHVLQSKKVKEKAKQTMLERHGVEHALQSNIFKELAKKTWFEKYKVKNPFQSPEVKEKIKQTMINKYNKQHPMLVDEVKEKRKETCIKNNGVEYPMQSVTIQNKYKSTSTKRYNSTNYTNRHISQDIQELINDPSWLKEQNETKTLFQISHEMKISTYAIESRFKKFNIPVKRHARSYFEKQVYEYILSIYQNIIQNDRTQIKPYELDVYLPTLNLAFECNGEYWHKEPQKEINKFDICKEKGIDLHFIWYEDWKKDQEYWKQYITNIIKQKSPN